MADQINPVEVVARSFKTEAAPTPVAPLTEVQRQAEQRAKELRGRLEKTPEDPMQAFKPVDEQGSDFSPQQKFTSEEEANLYGPPTLEQMERIEADQTISDADEYLKNGWDGTRTEVQIRMTTQVLERLDHIPSFTDLDPDDRADIAQGMLQDPKFKNVLEGFLKRNILPKDIDKSVLEALKAKKKELADVDGKLKTDSRELGEVKTKLESFDPEGEKGKKIGGLEIAYGGSTPKTPEELFVAAGAGNIQDAKAARIAVGQKIADGQEAAITGEGEKSMLQIIRSTGELSTLKAERAQLEAKLKQLEDDTQTEKNDRARLTGERDELQGKSEGVNSERAEQNRKLIETAREAIALSAQEYIDTEVQARFKLLEEINKEDIENAKNKNEAVIATARSKWQRKEHGKDGVAKTEWVRDQIDKDLDSYVNDPEGFIRNILTEEYKGNTLDSTEIQAQKKAEIDKIDEMLRTDRESVNKWKGEIAAELFLAKTLSGGKIKEEDMEKIDSDPEMEKALDAAIMQKAAKIDKKEGKKGDEKSLTERVGHWMGEKYRGRKTKIVLYTLLFLAISGSPVGGLIGATVGSTK